MCVARPVAVVEVVVEVWTKAHLPVSGRQPVGGAGERGTYLQFLDHLDVDPSATSDRRFVSRKGGGGRKKRRWGDTARTGRCGFVHHCTVGYSRVYSFVTLACPYLKVAREIEKKNPARNRSALSSRGARHADTFSKRCVNTTGVGHATAQGTHTQARKETCPSNLPHTLGVWSRSIGVARSGPLYGRI